MSNPHYARGPVFHQRLTHLNFQPSRQRTVGFHSFRYSNAGQNHSHRYDKNSGMVYVETEIPARPLGRSRGRTSGELASSYAPSRPGCTGPLSLEDLAIRELLRNIDELSADLLQHVPWTLGKKIWSHVEHMEELRMSVWRAFAAAYADEDVVAYHRASEIVPVYPLTKYIADISSASMQWLTCLTLSQRGFERAQVMWIANLHNLAALDICGNSHPSHGDASNDLVDDSLIRNWARRVQETPGAFSHLRVLILRNQPGVTSRSLIHLNSFPSLVVCGVYQCKLGGSDEIAARAVGWTSQDERGVLSSIKRDMEFSQTWDGPLKSCLERSAALMSYPVTEDPSCGDAKVARKPVLNFRLGHTSNDILFSRPLVFFRCLDNRHPIVLDTASTLSSSNSLTKAPIIPGIQYSSVSDQETAERNCKKRKLRVGAQRDVGAVLNELNMDIRAKEAEEVRLEESKGLPLSETIGYQEGLAGLTFPTVNR